MKKKTNNFKLGLLLALLMAFFATQSSWAATYYSIASGNWTNSGGTVWSLTSGGAAVAAGVYPASGDIVYIEDGDDVTLDADIETSNIIMRNVAAVNASSIILNGNKLTVSGNLSLTGGAAATNDVLLDGTAAGSELIVTGNVDINGITTDGISTLTMNAVSGRTTLTIGGNLTLSNTGATNIEAVLDITDCDVTISGTLTAVAANTTLTSSATTNLTLDGTTVVTMPVELTPLNKLIVNKTGIGTVTGPGAVTTIDTMTVTSGKFTKAAFALTINDMLTLADDINAQIDITAAGNVTIGHIATFGDAGILTTGTSTALILGTGTELGDIDMPSEVANLSTLVVNRAATSTVTLNGDLTTAGVLTLTLGDFVVGLNTLTTGGAFTNAGGTLDLTGSSIVFNGATHPVFTANVTTTSSTNMTFNTTEAAGVTFPDEIILLNNLTVNTTAGQTFTNQANLTLAGALTITSGTYVPGNFTLTVNGPFSMSTANAILTEDNAELILNGSISTGNAANLALSNATFDLTIGGSGSISITTPTVATTLNNLTMNRAGTTLSLTASGAYTIAGNLTITAGTVDLLSAQTYGVTGTTTIGSNGRLVRNVANALTFTDDFSGTGTFDAKTAAVVIASTCSYTFTGNFLTNTSTSLTINNSGVNLQSSVADLGVLVMNMAAATDQVLLNGNLTVATTMTATQGTLIVGANTLTITPVYTPGANFTLNANNSNVIITGAATLTNGTLTTNSSTNLTLTGGALATYPTSANVLNNLTIGSATTFPAADMTINGNLAVNGALTTAANRSITVYGTLSATAAINATATTNLYLYGDWTANATGTIGTPANLNIIVLGNGSQLSLPSTVTDFGTLVLNRASGMKINATITATTGLTAAPSITLTDGDLDLNGFNITLGAVAASISENVAGGATIINTGSDGAYITTFDNAGAGTTAANIIASGIGVTKATTGAGLVVRRYPKIKTIAGVNLSLARYYQVIYYTTAPTELTFKYDNTELGTNSAGSLKIYYTKTANVNEFLNTTTIDSSTTTTNTPGSATGTVAGTAFSTAIGTTSLFYAIASQSGATGVVRIFNNASGDGKWLTDANWNPVGAPTIDDDVTIGAYTVYLTGNGNTYYAKSLTLASPSSELKPYTGLSSGDTVNLVVNGNISINYAGGNIDGVNSYGRLNIQIGDGTTAVSSTITPSQDYSPALGGNGFSAHNLTVNNATVSYSGDNRTRLTAGLGIEGTSVFQPSSTGSGTLQIWGGYHTSQYIDVASIAALTLVNLELANGANVSTSSSFDVTENINIGGPLDRLIASDGTITLNVAAGASQTGWTVFPGGILRLWNLDIIADHAITPNGDIELQGDFLFSNVTGDETFTPTNGNVKFVGANQKQIINVAGADDLNFYNLVIGVGASAITSSSFYVNGDIDVQTNASLKADNGTITFANVNPDPSYIKNASNHTLEFYNLTIPAAETVLTSDSWTVTGAMSVDGTFTASNGTITFDNMIEKTLGTGGTATFFGIKVNDGSAVTTATSFSIANNSTNPSGAGLTVEGTGSFKATNNTITFTTTSNPGSGYPKTITKSSVGTLEFFNLAIATEVNNDVTTASDFEIIGTASAFVSSNAGLGGTFTATAGTITFSGTAAFITANLVDATTFYNLKADDITLTLTAGDYLNLAGNLIVDGTNGVFTIPTNAAGLLKFNGTAQQLITGTSIQTTPVSLSRVEINKTSGSTTDKEVLMQLDVTMVSHANSDLFLTSGYLNLGSKKLTNGLGEISYTYLGAINGGTGTFYNGADQATNVLLRDELFTVDNVPTLYNWTLGHAATLDGNLTINGALALEQAAANDLTLGAYTLTLYGDLSRTTGEFAVATGRLILAGAGTTESLSNSYFTGGACDLNITFGRTEVLTGNFTMAAGKDMTLNSGIGFLNIATYTLTTTTTATITRISGSITTGVGSNVVLGTTGLNNIPANLFTDNTCYNLNITGANRTLLGDLRIEGTLTGLVNITTGDNVLTFGPNATMPAYSSTVHVIGNLRRTVNNSATLFPIGGGTTATYRPLELSFSTTGSSQEFTVSSTNEEPTASRVGSPKSAVDVLWQITPVGTNSTDSLKMKFQWASSLEGSGKAANVTNGSFPARWDNGGFWTDYRNDLAAFSPSTPRVVTSSGFFLLPNEVNGYWAIFNADSNTTTAKDRAISKTANKVQITKIDPTPINPSVPFRVTLQLQNQYGQPIAADSAFYVAVTQELGGGTLGSTITGIIPAGDNSITLLGTFTNTAGVSNIQLKADTVGGSVNWMPTVSDKVSLLATQPATQALTLSFNDVNTTYLDFKVADNGAGSAALVVVKADTLLEEGVEFPVDGTNYPANNVYGMGANIGNAVVVKNDLDASFVAGTDYRVYGLSPNTKYYFYVFTYNGTTGNENYRLTPASGNPKAVTTLGSYDDDATLGTNNTRETSKTIGTNTPVSGTIKTADDIDWFNFTVTSASPNIRGTLVLSSDLGNYDIELYNYAGRRIRRGIRLSNSTEAQVINDLPAGTYTIKVLGDGTAYSSTSPYKLKVTTSGSEIFSVTP